MVGCPASAQLDESAGGTQQAGRAEWAMRDMRAAGREMVFDEANEKVLIWEEAHGAESAESASLSAGMAVTEITPLSFKVGRAAMQHYCKMGG